MGGRGAASGGSGRSGSGTGSGSGGGGGSGVSPGHVRVLYTNPALVRQVVPQIFGRKVRPQEFARMVGASVLSQIAEEMAQAQTRAQGQIVQSVSPTVRVGTEGYDTLKLIIKHPFIDYQERSIRRTYDADRGREIVELHHDYWRNTAAAPPRMALRVFSGAVRGAMDAGIDVITTDAHGDSSTAASGNFNGYYTWPRFGFNAEIPNYYKRVLPSDLQSANDLIDLYALPGGADWWKQNGGSIDAEFDLTPGSRSIMALYDYLRSRGLILI